MRVFSRTALCLTLLCLALSATTFAASNGYLYIVHGIPGRDVAADLNPGLPVDILLNNENCNFRGFVFGSSSGPLTLPAGAYDVKVSLANTLVPCSNPPVAEDTVTLSGGSSVTAVIALNGSGTPSLITFSDNLNPIVLGEGRFTFAHAADAPALQITLTQLGVPHPKRYTHTVNPGEEVAVVLPVGSYSLQATSGTTPVLSGLTVIENRTVTLTYIVGSASTNSVSLVNHFIGNVF
jgi:hypothetical protein